MSKIPIKHPNGKLYCQLMEQIKWRVDAVQETARLVTKNEYYLGHVPAAEFCLLQLRFCCELLAIGCIAIHTDVPQSTRLQSMYQADLIMNAFEKLKPRFWPNPSKNPPPINGVIYQDKIEGALTKPEMLKMYHLFGTLLHAGNFQRFAKPKSKTYDFKLLNEFVTKLIKLLNEHNYMMYDNLRMIQITMHYPTDGKVWLHEFEARPIV
jgi:hypothetical protein